MASNTVLSVMDEADDDEATSEDDNKRAATGRRAVLLRLVLVVTTMVILFFIYSISLVDGRWKMEARSNLSADRFKARA